MGKPLLFVDQKYVHFEAQTAEILMPFKSPISCKIIHFHNSPNCCIRGSRSFFLDENQGRLYCTDRGLKGGGTGSTKLNCRKTGLFYDRTAHQKAVELLDKAMKSGSPTLADSCLAVLFDCTDSGLLKQVIEIVTAQLKEGGKAWTWESTQGSLARIHCSRLLRIAAIRAKLQKIEDKSEASVMNEDQIKCSKLLKSSLEDLVKLAKKRKEYVLEAEFRTSWAVLSSLKTEEDLEKWLTLYRPTDIASLFSPASFEEKQNRFDPIMFYDLMQKSKDRSFSSQVILLSAIEFPPEVLPAHVQLVQDLLLSCKRWPVAVLCTSIVFKWLLTPDLGEAKTQCFNILMTTASFQTFVFGKNWKMRSGALWNVAALCETSKIESLQSDLTRILDSRISLEKNDNVLAPLKLMKSFKPTRLESSETYGVMAVKEVSEIVNFIESGYKEVNSEQTETDLMNYHNMIKKELKKGKKALRQVAATQNKDIKSEMSRANALISQLDARIKSSSQIVTELSKEVIKTQGKVVTLPSMYLIETRFSGRIEELSRLEALFSDLNQAKAVALVEPENMGKSWLAYKYASIHKNDYDILVSVKADSTSSIYLGLISLAKELGCEKSTDKETLEAVKSILTYRPKVLLIYDNADFNLQDTEDKYQAMMEYMNLVFQIKGHFLLTSRMERWREKMEIFKVQSLKVEEAAEVLRRVGEIKYEADARELARELKCIPLAVNQAASLLQRTKSPVFAFLEQLRLKIQQNSEVITAVLEMCFDSLTVEAKVLMELMASFGSFVSMEVVRGLQTNIVDTSLLSILAELRAAEFIDLDSHGVTVKRLFQDLAHRLCEEKEKRQLAVSRTLSDIKMSESTPSADYILNAAQYETKKEYICRADTGIAKTVADRFEDMELSYEERLMRMKQVEDAEASKEDLAVVVDSKLDMGRYLLTHKDINGAEDAFREAISIGKNELLLQVRAKSAYGRMLLKIEERGRAEEQLISAMATSHGLMMPDKDMADLDTNYAILKQEKKQDAEALLFFQKAIELRRKNPKGEKEIMFALLNLAYFYQTSSIKDLYQAEKLNIEALQMIREEKDKQKGAIYKNMAIIYLERYMENPESPDANELLEKRYEYLQKHLHYRINYQATPNKIDPQTAEILELIAEVHIIRKEFTRAIRYLEEALLKVPNADKVYARISKKIEAANFHITQEGFGLIEINR